MSRAHVATALCLIVGVSACGYSRSIGGSQIGFDTTDNSHRYILTNVHREADGGSVARTCLEPYSLAEVTHSLEATVKFDKVEAGAKYAEQVLQLITVGQTMQFLHATLFRLCEAYMNGAMSDTEYLFLFDTTLQRVSEILAQDGKTKLASAIKGLSEQKSAVANMSATPDRAAQMQELTAQIQAASQAYQSQVGLEEATNKRLHTFFDKLPLPKK